MSSNLYETLAADLGKAIEDGVLAIGERLPSIRQTAEARRLSVTTVKRAYLLLESRGMVEARPQAGYFVRSLQIEPAAAPSLRISMPEPVANQVDVARHVLTTLRAIRACNAVPLGSPYPDPTLFPWRRISQHSSAIAKRFEAWSAVDDIPPGNPELLRQIARRHVQNGLDVGTQDVVVTIGATEAINLCLQAVAKAGDTIAVESPCYYAMLQAIERNGMRAVEIPTHPEKGIDLAALEELMRRQRIDACLTMPNYQNPLGFEMLDVDKKAFVDLATRYDMPLIENGVYNEFHFSDTPPTTLKRHDTAGIVLFCGSFSKSLTAGVRIGWALPGRYRQKVETLKFLNTLSTPAIPQLAISEYLMHDGWDHHLRGVRQTLAQRGEIMRSTVARFFPEGTRISRPKGGYLLWIELPGDVDTLKIQREALDRGITLAPGRVFSNSDLYRSFMRLNFSYEWTPAFESAVKLLAAMAAAEAKGQAQGSVSRRYEARRSESASSDARMTPRPGRAAKDGGISS